MKKGIVVAALLGLLPASFVACGPSFKQATGIELFKSSNSTDGSTSAEPPPVTLGGYPCVIENKVIKSADGQTAIIHGVLAHGLQSQKRYDGQYGGGVGVIGTYSGTVKADGSFDEKLPVTVVDRMKGHVIFQLPVRYLNGEDYELIMTGPGYTNESFEKCTW